MREEIDLLVDLGKDFRVSGLGINARLLGEVRVTTTSEGTLRGEGRIAVAEGMYEAYGQRLTIDKGVLYFAGPLDNPGIEIRALRKNQQVEAGVELTGTARDPRARLVSTPEVPDAEKLSWLLYGRSVPQAGGAEQAQQAYALALAASVNALPMHSKLTKAVGLDEIRFAPATGESGTQAAGVISLGKQISDRIYLIYEQGLTSATSAIKINYRLAENWSVRTESGTTDALDVFYTISFD
jgi:translocation and assembly module TamB